MLGELTESSRMPQTRTEYVVEKLREIILRGHLRPGDRIDQEEIASLLSVSRSPVRAALHTLAAEGLIEITPHYSATVAKLDLVELQDIFLVRAMIEGHVAQSAVSMLGEDHLAEMRATLDDLDRTNDLEEWLAYNRRFHHAIYRVSASPRLFAIIENLRNTTAPYIREFIASSTRMEAAKAGHQRIFEACARRDGNAAKAETKKHLEIVCQEIVKSMSSESILEEDAPGRFMS